MNSYRTLVLCGLGFATGLIGGPAHAQIALPNGTTAQNRLVGAPKSAPGQGPSQAPPPAIPGVKTEPSAVAPSERPSADMAPNDALFDAINRGDTTAARDALNRGAELDTTNILGMTPLALSVDLGRDDITFILLSMRGAEPRRRGPTQEAAIPPVKPGRAPRVTATQVVARPARQAAPASAGNDAGTPNPGAGFLGFGSR